MLVRRPFVLAALVVGLTSAGSARAQFSIVIDASGSPGLSGNADALAAFNRAATAWSSRITSAVPTQINITAGLADLGNSTTIASASTSLFASIPFNTVRNAMAAKSGGADLAILSSLPTAATFTANLPGGVSLNGNMRVTTANAKALGIAGVPLTTGNDATITFNSQFLFDYVRSNGIGGSLVDFETVAVHEIGHALGFISSVDNIDAGVTSIAPTTWDVFRFNNAATIDAGNFATAAREMRPGEEAVQHDTVNSFRLSTGVLGGDGRQASHWKADELTGTTIGIMDPTLANGLMFDATEADFRGLALMGYSVTPVPEPAAVLGLAALGLAAGRRLRRPADATTLAA